MRKNKAFTILELLVVVAIIGIIAVIAIPNFVGRIEDAKASQELAEINAVGKAIATYYAEHGNYPTLQGKDGTLLQAQPIEGSPHNIDFSSLVPDYLATLPHFSYWWVDYKGDVYHTQGKVGTLTGNTFEIDAEDAFVYTVYNSGGTVANTYASGVITLAAGQYVSVSGGFTDSLVLNTNYKNATPHKESPEYVANVKPEATVQMSPSNPDVQSSIAYTVGFSDADGDTLLASEWKGIDNVVRSTPPNGVIATQGTYTVGLRVQDTANNWSEWVYKTFTVGPYIPPTSYTVNTVGSTVLTLPTTLRTGDTVRFNSVSSATLLNWTLPENCVLSIEAYGSTDSAKTIRAGKAGGTVVLSAGDHLSFKIFGFGGGGTGGGGGSSANCISGFAGSAGGAGTVISKNGTQIIIAGGAGGVGGKGAGGSYGGASGAGGIGGLNGSTGSAGGRNHNYCNTTYYGGGGAAVASGGGYPSVANYASGGAGQSGTTIYDGGGGGGSGAANGSAYASGGGGGGGGGKSYVASDLTNIVNVAGGGVAGQSAYVVITVVSVGN